MLASKITFVITHNVSSRYYKKITMNKTIYYRATVEQALEVLTKSHFDKGVVQC